MDSAAKTPAKPRKKGGSSLGTEISKHLWLYIMLIPGVLYFIIFKYLPMGGIVIAFENYVPFSGITGSKWVGLY